MTGDKREGASRVSVDVLTSRHDSGYARLLDPLLGEFSAFGAPGRWCRWLKLVTVAGGCSFFYSELLTSRTKERIQEGGPQRRNPRERRKDPELQQETTLHGQEEPKDRELDDNKTPLLVARRRRCTFYEEEKNLRGRTISKRGDEHSACVLHGQPERYSLLLERATRSSELGARSTSCCLCCWLSLLVAGCWFRLHLAVRSRISSPHATVQHLACFGFSQDISYLHKCPRNHRSGRSGRQLSGLIL